MISSDIIQREKLLNFTNINEKQYVTKVNEPMKDVIKQ